jgi:hypothetical protein
MRGTTLPLGAAALLVIGAFVLVSPVAAKLTRDTKPASKTGLPPETGGQRVLSSRPFHSQSGQFGRMIVTCQGLERLGMAPPLIGWLPFPRFGWGGPMPLTPFGDGAVGCMVLP